MKVGDKVKIIEYGGETNKYPVGKTGVITEITDRQYFIVKLDTPERNDSPMGWYCYPTELEVLG